MRISVAGEQTMVRAFFFPPPDTYLHYLKRMNRNIYVFPSPFVFLPSRLHRMENVDVVWARKLLDIYIILCMGLPSTFITSKALSRSPQAN